MFLSLLISLAMAFAPISPMDGVGGPGGKPSPPPLNGPATPAPATSTVSPMDGVGGPGGHGTVATPAPSPTP